MREYHDTGTAAGPAASAAGGREEAVGGVLAQQRLVDLEPRRRRQVPHHRCEGALFLVEGTERGKPERWRGLAKGRDGVQVLHFGRRQEAEVLGQRHQLHAERRLISAWVNS